MTDVDRGQTVVDHVGACRCPGTPHASGETVSFRPSASIAMGSAAMSARRDAANADEFVGLLAGIELRFGIESWTCRDEKGSLAITSEAIAERFPWPEGGADLAERADELYGEDLLRPLVERIRRSSSAGPTETPTPPTPDSGTEPPEGSPPSSPESTATSPSEDPAP